MTKSKLNSSIVAGSIIILLLCTFFANAQINVSYMSGYGYDSCLLLKNKNVEVILEPNVGGRVIRYALNGVNVLYEDSVQNGWVSSSQMPRSSGHLAGGRFDIGPSKTKPSTDLFFFGKWSSKVTGQFSVRLTSQIDPLTKTYLIRDFVLDPTSSKLTITQTIVNTGSQIFRACFWGRTFVTGNGICMMPVNRVSRFPKKYIMFMNRDTMNMFPTDTNILVKDDLLIIKGPPQKPKLEMDVDAPGWIAYSTTSNHIFIKKFKVYSDRQYGEVSAANASVWYNGTQMTEIEPIGPWELISPGNRKSFTEYWYLGEYKFPVSREIDTEHLKQIVYHLMK